MSQERINRSPDLKRLRDEGYDVSVKSGFLLIRNVPYVNSKREVRYGTLVSELTLAGDVTTTPSTHVVSFAGEHPCHKDGAEILGLKHQTEQRQLDSDLIVDHSFSNKPKDGYKDYYEKMTTYIRIISGPAQAIDPDVTAQTYPVIEAAEDESVFQYWDTASSRAEIVAVSRKLELGNIAIVGLGGSGSYVLDQVAKTPVKAIHLFDGDNFSQHNAFRSPGAASIEELRQKPKKVVHFQRQYSRMHRNIIANAHHVDASNVEQLRAMDFVFLCLDKGSAKKPIAEKLEEWGIPFIDIGMGIELVDESLQGILRITSSTIKQRLHVWTKKRIPFSDAEIDDDYSRNIQVADLNALNAMLAVIKWKKIFGFYLDLENEHYSTYTIDGNTLINEDQP